MADISVNGVWLWSSAWRDLFPVLNNMDQITIAEGVDDMLVWKIDSTHYPFSINLVWQSIETMEQRVEWCKGVWFSQCLPKHAFILWLILREKLLTQEKMMGWNNSRKQNMNMMCCLLCYANYDSRVFGFRNVFQNMPLYFCLFCERIS